MKITPWPTYRHDYRHTKNVQHNISDEILSIKQVLIERPLKPTVRFTGIDLLNDKTSKIEVLVNLETQSIRFIDLAKNIDYEVLEPELKWEDTKNLEGQQEIKISYNLIEEKERLVIRLYEQSENRYRGRVQHDKTAEKVLQFVLTDRTGNHIYKGSNGETQATATYLPDSSDVQVNIEGVIEHLLTEAPETTELFGGVILLNKKTYIDETRNIHLVLNELIFNGTLNNTSLHYSEGQSFAHYYQLEQQ